MTSDKFIWVAVLLVAVSSGCEKFNRDNQPVTPKVDLSKKRIPHEVKIEDLVFPDDFPKQVGMAGSYHIYEQDENLGVVTWDSRLTPKEVRDYYVAEFKKLGFKTEVSQPKGMPGENFEIKGFDAKNDKWHCVGVGKQRPEAQVSCFIYSLTTEEIEKEKARQK